MQPHLRLPLLLLICLGIAAPAQVTPSVIAQDASSEELDRWIADLASPVFTTRQAATKNLAARGVKAIPALIDLCESSRDRETVTRGVQVLAQLLDSRDGAVVQTAESSLKQLARSADKSLAHLAKTSLDRWRMQVSIRTVDRLKRLGATVGQPTTAADGTPEVYLQIYKKDWKGQDSDLALLPDLGRIGLFKVDSAPIGNDGLRFLEKCSYVEKIYLDHTQVDARGLSIIAKAPGLRKLTLIGLSTIDRTALEGLTNISTLEHLSLDACEVTPGALSVLPKIASLKQLELPRTKIASAQLAALAELPHLSILNLTGVALERDGIAALAKAPVLDTLNLRAAELAPGVLDEIGRLNQVRYLVLDEVDLHAADFSKLADMSGLRRLDISKCQITDNNAWTLGTLKGVTYLLLSNNQISSNVRDRIAAELTKSQILP